MDEKESFKQAITFLRKKKGLFLDTYEKIERVKCGIVGVDFMLGGGVPRGRIVEIYGEDSSGKTTLAAEIASSFIERGQRVMYLDYEHSADLAWFEKLGIPVDDDDDQFLYEQPFSLEIGADAALKLINTGEIGLLVVDSVAGMVPQKELEGAMVDEHFALQARKFGRFLSQLSGAINRNNTCAILLNQVRAAMGHAAQYNPERPYGGWALKHYASVRIQLKRRIKNSRRARLKKQKTSPNQVFACDFEITEKGIDRVGHLKSVLTTTIIENRAGSFFLDGKKVCRGKDSFSEYVTKNYDDLSDRLLTHWDTGYDEEDW